MGRHHLRDIDGSSFRLLTKILHCYLVRVWDVSSPDVAKSVCLFKPQNVIGCCIMQKWIDADDVVNGMLHSP